MYTYTYVDAHHVIYKNINKYIIYIYIYIYIPGGEPDSKKSPLDL